MSVSLIMTRLRRAFSRFLFLSNHLFKPLWLTYKVIEQRQFEIPPQDLQNVGLRVNFCWFKIPVSNIFISNIKISVAQIICHSNIAKNYSSNPKSIPKIKIAVLAKKSACDTATRQTKVFVSVAYVQGTNLD